ncbi:MAG TPA: alanine--tRNA ligase [Gemmatimonadales bacterium]
MEADKIRQSFVEYFGERGHEPVPSSPLVPHGDPTLLFTNAGMVQFKRVFQGIERRASPRAVTVQKCVRAGGKHNDLEQVGHTARHHTFFEMLGNFSFGDYFKREAIAYGWEWVTSDRYLGIDPDRLYVSVHHEDEEARALWREVTGIDPRRIYGLGDADNFWQMGDTGPCGPCSEIFIDLRAGRAPSRTPPIQSDFEALAESGALLEIWNLVFMQFDQAADGSRTPLPAPSVDTGAGLERIAAVMQETDSNFHTDLFLPIIETAAELIEHPYDPGPAGAGFRVLADHARAVTFLLADGVYPSNDGRGYVLRRILRRAVRHAYLLGRPQPTLVHLADRVIELMGAAYPELVSKRDHIHEVTQAEEERFLETIEGGLWRLDKQISGPSGVIGGDEAFRLYDTYGFPLDLTQVIAGERGWTVDVAGFQRALVTQQERSRAAGMQGTGDVPVSLSIAGSGTTRTGSGTREGSHDRARGRGRRKGKWTRVIPRRRQRFVGYETTETETDILAFRHDAGRLELVLHDNPFYAESGGQVSDTGTVRGDGWQLTVDDVLRIDGKQVAVGAFESPFEPTPVTASVTEGRRRDIERNHTATHLAHAALHTVLGDHARQAGSVVAPDRLRFDFSHHVPVTDDELARIEEIVNQGIWANVDVDTYQLPYADALARGAMALFGEKYGDVVRVVDIAGLSVELCGGTHVRTTGQIGMFHFTAESGVAAGVRRIEAVTGPGAYEIVRALDARLGAIAEVLRTSPEHVGRKVESLLAERRVLAKQIEDLLQGANAGGGGGTEHVMGKVRLVVDDAPVTDRGQIGTLMDNFRRQAHSAVSVLFTGGTRPGVHVAVTDDLIARGIRAGDLVRRIAEIGGGSGGGRPHFASGGIGNPEQVEATKAQVPRVVRDALGALAE